MSYSQTALLSRLNHYLQLNHRDLRLNQGYCHGLTLLWLTKISEGKEEWFYETIKHIVHADTEKKLFDLSKDIEKFLSYIEWGQNSNRYLRSVNQLDTDKIVEMPKMLSLSYLFSHQQLNKILHSIIPAKKLISLSGPNHTIGLYRNNYGFLLYDPNYETGEPKLFSNVKALQKEIIKSLYMNGKTLERFPLQINILNPNSSIKESLDKNDLFNHLIESDHEIDHPGFLGVTNLFLACESGDELEVKGLLVKGANPNHPCKSIYPLSLASSLGYDKIVTLLLKHHAKPNMLDANGFSALYYAIQKKHTASIDSLLEAGANPLAGLKEASSPLYYCIKNHDWSNLIKLLAKLDITTIKSSTFQSIIKYENEINKALTLQPISLNSKRHIQDIFKKLTEKNEGTPTFFRPFKVILPKVNRSKDQHAAT